MTATGGAVDYRSLEVLTPSDQRKTHATVTDDKYCRNEELLLIEVLIASLAVSCLIETGDPNVYCRRDR